MRLRPVVADRPKALAELQGRPFITYLLDMLAAAGLKYVVLCVGYQGEKIKALLGRSYRGLQLAYSKEQEPLGTAGALRASMELFKSDPVLVMNGDSFCQVDLKQFWSSHHTQNVDATLLLTKVADTARYGRVVTAKDNFIRYFEEKEQKSCNGWINAGSYLISQRFLATIPPGHPVSLEYDMFPNWLSRGIYSFRSAGPFIDIGTPKSYAAADHFFREIA